MDMQQKRYQQIENLRLQRRNFNAAKRLEKYSQQAGKSDLQGDSEKNRQERFNLCWHSFRNFFADVKSAVFNEYYQVEKFDSPKICDSVPKSAFLGKGECYEDILNMYIVLVKEVKLFLDPKSNPQYAEQVVDINKYAEHLKELSQNCIESYLQESSPTEAAGSRSVSSDCQAAHRQALSQLGSQELAGELPFDQFTLVSSGIEFAFDGNNLR